MSEARGASAQPAPPVVMVTGAGRGTGQAMAMAFGRAGARVAILDVNPDAAQRTTEAVLQTGAAARAETVDISNKLALQTAFYAVLEAWERVDILVNAAHVTPESSALKLDEWEWNRVLDVNLKGAFLAAQTAARAMQTTGGGVIFNVIRPEAASPHAAVRAARAGLIGLTEALAEEWRPQRIRVQPIEAAVQTEAAELAVRLCADMFERRP